MQELRGEDFPKPRIPPVRHAMSCLAALLIVGAMLSAPANAQRAASPQVTRAESLASRGDSLGARILIDSILADTDPAAPIFPGALYWRGALAARPSDARKDLLRLIVDYPFSDRAGDALYRLAQDEIATGDQSNARRHLARLVRDHSSTTHGSAGAFQLGKMLMADGEVLAACAALDSALQYEPAENIELRNQITYVQRPCDRARANAASVVRSTDSVEAARGANPSRGAAGQGAPGRGAAGRGAASTPAPTPRPSGNPTRADSGTAGQSTVAVRWSVQVAAFGARADAAALAARLKSRGYDSRVVDERPYRVRIGRFATRAQATALVAKLKAENTAAIIVEAERP